jgi:hypothetical protein
VKVIYNENDFEKNYQNDFDKFERLFKLLRKN